MREWPAEMGGRNAPCLFPEHQDSWPTWRTRFGVGSCRVNISSSLIISSAQNATPTFVGRPHLPPGFGSLWPWIGPVTQSWLILETGPFDWSRDKQRTEARPIRARAQECFQLDFPGGARFSLAFLSALKQGGWA